MADAVRLAVSNIAWEPHEDDVIADVLRREQVGGVEIAPTKWRERPFDASASDVLAYRRHWEDRGLRIVSLQSLLFGRPDLQLFASAAQRAELGDYLRQVIDFGATVGAHALVFGSPKNRLRGPLPLPDAMKIAAELFRPLGEHAATRGLALCIEANPAEYGCDFVTTTAEAAELCRLVDHPGIRINADVGGMALAGEDPAAVIESASQWLAHVHASEPHLGELSLSERHTAAASALKKIAYDGWVSVEMRGRTAGGNSGAVERAVRSAKGAYCTERA